MPHSKFLAAAAVAVLFAGAPALAQSDANNTHGTSVPPTTTNTTGSTTESGNANSTSDIAAAGGFRSSKIVGSTVYNNHGDSVGTVDDLIISPSNRTTTAILSVGGFLGMGERLVQVPFSSLRFSNNKVTYPGVTKQKLESLPAFHYTKES